MPLADHSSIHLRLLVLLRVMDELIYWHMYVIEFSAVCPAVLRPQPMKTKSDRHEGKDASKSAKRTPRCPLGQSNTLGPFPAPRWRQFCPLGG